MSVKLLCELKVRSYELDAYGHVNHAVFLNYYEQARVEYLEQKQMSFGSLLEEGFVFIIVRAEVDYLKPLSVGDRIEIIGEIVGVGNSSITIAQQIQMKTSGEIVSRAKYVAVFVDKKSGKPATVPESFRRAFMLETLSAS